MPFSTALADRIRKLLGKRAGLTEKKMFGGIGFLVRGNMCCGVHGEDMIVRLSPEQTDAALAKAHTKPFDLTGRPMKGWILVDPKGLGTEAEISHWIATSTAYAESLPAK